MHRQDGLEYSGRLIRKVCVVGAGVMGQAIAAHMINAGLDCMLIDMPKSGPDRNQLANDAIKKIQNSKPSLIFSKPLAELIKTGNIEDDLPKLKNIDLIIEAIVEKVDIKQGLFKKIEAFIGPHTIVASNTSGLSLEAITAGLSPSFC